MDQHPVPRQITTFEFKLIGFMTLKQFLYLVVSVPLGFIAYALFPIPFLNIFVGVVVALVGVVFAFVPIQDRPMDVWIRNLFKRLNSPTQYFYHKTNQPLYFLKELYFMSDPHKVMTHIESKEKLAAYLAQKRAQSNVRSNVKQKQHIQSLLRQNTTKTVGNAGVLTQQEVSASMAQPNAPLQQVIAFDHQETLPTPHQPALNAAPAGKHPFFIGVVKSSKEIPLPGVLIYVKDSQHTPLRLLKTNPNGVFATYSPLPPGDYFVEMKDPNGRFFFDTMKIRVEAENPAPFQFYSKELL